MLWCVGLLCRVDRVDCEISQICFGIVLWMCGVTTQRSGKMDSNRFVYRDGSDGCKTRMMFLKDVVWKWSCIASMAI